LINPASGDIDFDEADSRLLVGTNPLVSKATGIPGQNPGQSLRNAIKRGMKLVVIDPRRSQTAARAAIHIQPHPGEDPSVLAGMINVINENLCDTEFLELLVTIETQMSLTSTLADYVMASKMQMEVPASTQLAEQLEFYASGMGMQVAYAQYAPRLVDPPSRSDLTEEWLFYRGLAKRMNLDLHVVNFFGSLGAQYMESPPVIFPLAPSTDLTTEELIAELCANSRIPLDDVATHPHGHIYDVDAVVAPKDPDCAAKLDVGNAHMVELSEVREEDFRAARSDPAYPLWLIPRRHNTLMNSSGTRMAKLNDGKP
jgi:anaerobic selenocysteine-containing dehydrogenase